MIATLPFVASCAGMMKNEIDHQASVRDPIEIVSMENVFNFGGQSGWRLQIRNTANRECRAICVEHPEGIKCTEIGSYPAQTIVNMDIVISDNVTQPVFTAYCYIAVEFKRRLF